MIDLHALRESPELYQDACRKKGIKFDVSEFLKLDSEVKQLRQQVEALRAEQNSFSKEIPKLTGADKEAKLKAMKDVAARFKDEGLRLKEIEQRWLNDQLQIPSLPLTSVPEGKDDSENVEVSRWGEPPKFDFQMLDHVELGQRLDLLDLERGVKIAGSRNYFLKGDLARLQHALLRLAEDVLHRKGYTLIEPPHIVKYEAMVGTGYFPGGEDQAYALDERDPGFHLIGTSEVSVASYHMDEILNEDELPKRYAGYSPCYRREAGTYGRDTHGLYRIHQFYKIEQVIICRADPAESARYHQELLGNAEELMQLLKLPYRVVNVCTGDMGRGQTFKNDIEVWMPSRNGFGETHSCSTFYDFQARRLNLRYKDRSGKNVFCHTLNNTLIASPRILIPIMEIYQNKDGTITVPEAVRPYLAGQERIG